MATSPAAAEAPSQAAPTHWMTGPLKPRLGAEELHVWQVDLRAVDDATQRTLSAQERSRAAAIADPDARALWVCSRGTLRALLGRYLQLPPAVLQIVSDEHGKPSLLTADTVDAHKRSLSFSLSHSGHIALYGVTTVGAVGVDVQLARGEQRGSGEQRSPRDHVALARRAFGEREAERLRALPAPLRETDFLRLWTRHEAELKCLGVGIGGERVQLRADRWVLDLDLERRERPPPPAAVAAERPPRTLRLWRA